MTVGYLKKILEFCKDDAHIMIVAQIGEKMTTVDDIVAFAPSDGSESITDASGIYLYGDSCDFLEDDYDC